MGYKYNIHWGVARIKTKTTTALSILSVGVLGLGSTLAFVPGLASADSANVNFENPPYTTGTINGQDGWSSLGAAGSGCAVYDHAVGSSFGTPGFGSQSLRISNAVVSGCFGDQTFSKPLANEAGETTAENGGMSGGNRQNHFESQFSLASVTPGAEQSGLYMSVSPDRGDGARMSYLRFEDQSDGIHVFFDDYQDFAPFGSSNLSDGCGDEDNFIETDIATLNRTRPHSIKFDMNFVDGPGNDVVKIYIDGNLVKTGTSWEDYFRYCEGTDTSRTVDSLLFRTGGTQGVDNALGTLGKGFLIDNLKLSSGNIPFDKNDCKNGGWRNLTNANGQPFRNQGQCIDFVEDHQKDNDHHDRDHRDNDGDHGHHHNNHDHHGDKNRHHQLED